MRRLKTLGIAVHVVLSMLLCHNVTAQNPRALEVLSKVTDLYKTKPNYQIQFEFNFKRGTALKSAYAYKGILEKREGITKLSLLDTEVLSFPQAHLTINHTNKTILFRKSTKAIVGSPVDISTFLEYFEIKAFKAVQTQWICELKVMSKDHQTPYHKVVLYIDKESYTLEKQELFFANKMPFQTEEGTTIYDKAQLDILCKHSTNATALKAETLGRYISFSNKKDCLPSKHYKDYQVTVSH